ncbi:NAD(P)H-binding protein [Marimonas sp. MJW-29]|uniref:NAD(P)H-binding protein n=1 Tax=Sulfitobacter sediminis TaxID=3234186 RepID=A0ABV3RKM3_9RHOB
MPTVIVLGAKGRFGRAATTAFADAGWHVRTFARGPNGQNTPQGDHVIGDVRDAAALTVACKGCDVIVNAINPPYEKWSEELPPITRAVIAAARATSATVLLPGNVYNYGADAPNVLTEQTAWRPTTRKGRLRVEMEEAYRRSGVRTIVLRAGDFVEREASGNWFDALIAAKAAKGRTVYPGPLDRVHAWAYLPDAARAAVMLAERREEFGTFEEFGFSGYALTGNELADAIGTALGRQQKVGGLPWPVIRLLALFRAAMYEIYEMRYLWQVPHAIDGRKLTQTLPDFVPTPVEVAMKEVLAP